MSLLLARRTGRGLNIDPEHALKALCLGHRRQARHEVQRFEDDVRHAVSVRRLQLNGYG